MSYTTYYNQIMAANDKSLKKELEDNETLHANQAKVIKENYGLEIDSKNQAYDEDLRANEVQKYINMREVAENNANLGLTDSGLNRTQSTAVQLSASNNAAKIERDRNNMVRALEVEMNRYLTENENSRISSAASIQKTYEDSAMSSAVDMYKADVDAAAKASEAKINAQTQASKEARTALTAFIKDFDENSYDKTQAAKKIRTYVNLYGWDETTMNLLLSHAGISGDEYSSYLENGNFPDTPQLPLEKRTWTLVHNGGVRGGKIDDDAVVKDQYENFINMRDLYDALQSESGMSASEAKKKVVELEKDLGIW